MTTENDKCPKCRSGKVTGGSFHQSQLCKEREARQKAEAELDHVRDDNEMMQIRHAAVMRHTQGVVDENAKLREILDRLFTDGISCLEIHQIRAEYNQLTK